MPERFSASKATRLMQCHASADLERAIPTYEPPPPADPDDDSAASRGTRIHEMFAAVMSLPYSDAKYLSAAMQYVFEVVQRRRYKKLIEVEWVADWLPSQPRTTADLVLYLRDEMHVFDLKTGKSPISAVDNDQLMFYAATYWEFAPLAKEIHLHIVQPWADNCEEHVITHEELFAWMEKAVEHDDQITNGDLTFGPGDHCTFCPANPHSRAAKGKPSCPVMMQLLYPPPSLDDDALMRKLEE
jgi:hypothetical protein